MPVHPLIAQAIEDALAPLGAGRIERVPVTRADVHALVRAAAAADVRRWPRREGSA
jgi:hypothetical protein